MPTVAPARPPPGTSVRSTPSRPPAVEARIAMRGSGSERASAIAPSVPSVTAGVSRREPAARPTRANARPTIEPRIRNSRPYADAASRRATDLDRRRRVDGERRDDGRDQSDEPDRRGDAGPPPAEQRDAAGTDGDDQVQDEGHRSSTAADSSGNASGDQIGIESGDRRARRPGMCRSPAGRGAGRGSALSAKPSAPSWRAAMARTATAPPRPTMRRAVTIWARAVGVPSSPAPTSKAPCISRSSPMPMRSTSRPVTSGADREGREGESGRLGLGRPETGGPEAVLVEPDDGRSRRQGALGDPPDGRPAGVGRRRRGPRSRAGRWPGSRRRPVPRSPSWR